MRTGRNDPCPCGSGRKYKQCCQQQDRAAWAEESGANRLGRQYRQAAAAEPDWEADAVPIMARFEESGSPRPVMLIVTAGEFIVHADIRGRLPGETADVAAALERAVTAAARDVGAFPERLRVRHDDVAAALAPLLAERGVEVRGGGVPVLEATAHAMLESVVGVAFWPPVCRADTWSGWDLPRPLVAELFTAAAHYYIRAPWTDAANLQAPRATLPSGRAWTCGMLGNAGEEFGLALYSEESDLFRTAMPIAPSKPFDGVRGRIISVTFDRPAEVHPDMRREVRMRRWNVAGPAAIPTLMTVNTPAGGIAQDDVRDLIDLFGALPLFVQKHRRALLAEERSGTPVQIIDWVEPDSGIAFRYDGQAVRYDPFPWDGDDDDDDDAADPGLFPRLPPELHADIDALIGQVVEEFGADADEDELLDALNVRLEALTRSANEQPAADFGGLSPAQVHLLLQGDWADSASALQLRLDLSFEDVAGSTILANARTLLEFAVEHGPPGATQAGNLKLDAVAQLVERMTFEEGYLEEMRSASRRITEQDVWPLHCVRVVCELAGLLRRRSQRFDLTAAGRTLADAERVGKLYALLFRTWFREFNMDYVSRWEWPELQHQVAWTLYRLPAVAQDWRSAVSLLPDVVLPHALHHAPRAADLELAPSNLAAKLLEPLAGFGLLERRVVEAGSRGRGTELYRAAPLAERFLRFDL